MKPNYILDLDKIMNFVFDVQSDKQVDTEIVENYSLDNNGEMVLVNRTVKENKASEDNMSQKATRYDLVKSFIEILVSLDPEEETSFGEQCVLNTMQAYNFIKEIKVKK